MRSRLEGEAIWVLGGLALRSKPNSKVESFGASGDLICKETQISTA